MQPIYSIEPEKYKLYRPNYGEDIYHYINELVDFRGLAWDCACGSGQVSSQLARSFQQVMASDIDSTMLAKAPDCKNVEYHKADEEFSLLKNESVDFLSVATAIHWLDRTRFFKEAKRVLKPGGVLGTWGYTGIDLHEDINKTLKEIVQKYFMPYYPQNIKIAFERYEEIELPFEPIDSPNFEVNQNWTFLDLKNYFMSFTAMQYYYLKHGELAFDLFEDELLEAWGGNPLEKKNLKWEIYTKFSRK